MAWQTPKTDWDTEDGVADSDLNRMESNSEYLYDQTRILKGYLRGFKLHGGGGSAFAIFPGECMDDTVSNPTEITFTGMSKTSAAWVAGEGNGSVAPGVNLSAYTWYYIFVIKNSVSGASDIQIDSDVAGANISAAGFTLKRRVGTIKTHLNPLNFYFIYSNGDEYFINGGPSGSESAASFTVPETNTLFTLTDSVYGRLTPDIECKINFVLTNVILTQVPTIYLWPEIFGASYFQGVQAAYPQQNEYAGLLISDSGGFYGRSTFEPQDFGITLLSFIDNRD